MLDGAATVLPYTGAEYLESIRDDREVWIHGERVEDVTAHPAFRNSARSIARLYDALHDPVYQERLTGPTDTGNGGFTHPGFVNARTVDDLVAARAAMRVWAELSFGWMGRTPDYKAGMVAALGAHPEWYGEYKDNAVAWYRKGQERIPYLGHAIVHPPVDRHLPFEETRDVFFHVEKETDNGLVVSGAKVVATGAPLTHSVFVSHYGPAKNKDYAVVCMAPTAGKGVKLLARTSYELNAATTGSPFDYPLSSRLDENDSILVFDHALIPWEDVLVYDVQKMAEFDHVSAWPSRALLQSATRMAVKLEFLIGAMSKALDIKGGKDAPPIRLALGEAITWRNTIVAMTDGMIQSATPHAGGNSLIPNSEFGVAYAALAPQLYRRVKEIIQTVVASGLIYLNSSVADFEEPTVRAYLDRFLRGSAGLTALDRSKTMKLLWDAIGTEFGGRHELYELNYFGAPALNYSRGLELAEESGDLQRWRGLAEACMDDYDLKGWTAPGLLNPSDVSVVATRRGR